GFWDLFADPRLLPHLHLPMQSGSDTVLRRMARRCRTTEFARLAEQARAAIPGLNITTDIIVGFPGETDSEWAETLDFVEATGFGQVHAFAYSPRDGTRAAALPGRVDAATTRRRSQELRVLGEQLWRRVLKEQTRACAAVLREAGPRTARPNELFGYTPNYLPILVDPALDAPPIGEIMEVEVLGPSTDGDYLRGRLALTQARHQDPGWIAFQPDRRD
ncbi:MAG: radical SAM protein, partial [Chromatiaceae bacterium]